jgi:uncharacterized membrane protein YdbT with pleckstrin-like domain
VIDLLIAIFQPLLKISHLPPPVPHGAADVRCFKASPRYLSYRYLVTALGLVPVIVPCLLVNGALWFATTKTPVPRWVALLVTVVYGGAVLLSAALAFVSARLDYEFHCYVSTDKSLRIRQGIWEQVEATLTYANVQNVRVVQGPLERFFGFASVVVETAGGSAKPAQGKLPRGTVRGIEHAAELRDQIMAKMRASRSTGLGDPDDHHDGSAGHLEPHGRSAELLREIRDEARGLAADLRGLSPSPRTPRP